MIKGPKMTTTPCPRCLELAIEHDIRNERQEHLRLPFGVKMGLDRHVWPLIPEVEID